MSKPDEEKIPEWVHHTPDEDDYELSMDRGDGGEARQSIELTRGEYVFLKRALAKRRGYLHQPQEVA